jgi:hypothetical protein
MSEKFHSNEENQAETPESQIQAAGNLDAVCRVLDKMDTLPEGENNIWMLTGPDVTDIIDKIRDGQTVIDAIPDVLGLREKVKTLFVTEALAEASNEEELEAAFNRIATALPGENLTTQNGTEVSLEEIKDSANAVIVTGANANLVTSKYGLRDAVERVRDDRNKHFSPLN